MEEKMSNLFDSIIIKNNKIKNRVVVPPMVCFGYAGTNGFVTKSNIEHYQALAIGGAGIIILEAHAVEENGKSNSNVFTLPIEGGKPFRVTPIGPSYWHGWSPDGTTLVYCAERNGEYDVYQCPAKGGQEKQLTNAPGLDDGPEYSPDGKSLIYISYSTEVPATSHPHNQRVMLRIQPVNGKEAKVMAHIYGGQGTGNVPAWSPDSKKVAFVSYTYGDPK